MNSLIESRTNLSFGPVLARNQVGADEIVRVGGGILLTRGRIEAVGFEQMMYPRIGRELGGAVKPVSGEVRKGNVSLQWLMVMNKFDREQRWLPMLAVSGSSNYSQLELASVALARRLSQLSLLTPRLDGRLRFDLANTEFVEKWADIVIQLTPERTHAVIGFASSMTKTFINPGV